MLSYDIQPSTFSVLGTSSGPSGVSKRKVVEVAEVGGKLHAGCFKCTACATSLVGGAFKVQARQPYCNGAKFSVSCEKN